ncbi:MAG: SusC/RagA family TonB-linked outer membrane protein [Chitinophagaceae bacterium]
MRKIRLNPGFASLCLCLTATVFPMGGYTQNNYVAAKKIKQTQTESLADDPAQNKTTSLFQVLTQLNKKKGVYFLFADTAFANKQVSAVYDEKKEIGTILDLLLQNTGLTYKRVGDNTFVILRNTEKTPGSNGPGTTSTTEESLSYSSVMQSAYDAIRGKVTSSNGAALQGVSITVKGTSRGVSTGHNGEFVIQAEKGEVLLFSIVGYQSREVVVGSDPVIEVRLEQLQEQLNEVIVTALGIRKEAKRVGYAVSTVPGEQLTKAREINIGNALVGRVAGVNSTGPLTGPGGSSRVTIRGNSSLTFDNQPLYVINGIPMNNDNMGNAGKWGGADLGDGISAINPDDIEEMTVLKGAAAAALYGQRGRNGVILITTKSGKTKKTLGVEFNSNATLERINDFTDFQQEYGQGTQGNKPTDATSARLTGLSSWGAKLDGSMLTLFDGKQHPYSAVSKDNLKDFYKTGSTFTNTIAFSGGGENGSYRLSLGDLRNSGVYPNSKYQRNNANLDLNYKLSEKWSGRANVTYVKEVGTNRSNLSDAPGNGNYAILFLPANVKGEYLAPGYDANGNEIRYSGDDFSTNPYFAANRFQNNTSKDRMLGVASLKFAPVNWFYVQARIANDFFSFNATQITPTGTAYRPAGSLDLERTNTFNEFNADLLAGFNKNITKNIGLNITAGGNLLRMKQKITDINASAFAFPYLYNPATAGTKNATISTPKKEVQSLYASAELSYKSIFFLNITDRNDWSSTLPANNNSYNYPSVNASYVFSENFKPMWLDFGKLRVGYAMVGGDAPVFSTALYYNTLGSTINGVALGNLENKIPNNAIEPLKIKELEAGIELKMLHNRLSLDVSVYKKQTLNDIVEGTVSQTSGYTSAILNIGKIENKGIEIAVGGTPVATRNFTWASSFNFSRNNNKVIQLAEGQTFMQVPGGESRTERAFIQHIVGMPFAQVMAFDYKKDAKGNLVLDATNLPQADGGLTSFGTGVHPVTGGWSNDVTFKNLTLSFLIDYKYGGVIYSGTNARAYSYGVSKETLPGRQGGVAVKGVDDQGNVVNATVDAQTYYGRLSSISKLHIYDADFIKFRSLSLTYNFNPAKLGKKVQGLSLSLVGRNLFYIHKATDNIDPEANYNNTNAQGLEYAGLPSTRSIGLNLNVKF